MRKRVKIGRRPKRRRVNSKLVNCGGSVSVHSGIDDYEEFNSGGIEGINLEGAERQRLSPGDLCHERSWVPAVPCPENIMFKSGPHSNISKHVVCEDNFFTGVESLLLPHKSRAEEIDQDGSMWEEMPCCGSNITPSPSCPLVCECNAYPVHHCVYRCCEAGLMMLNTKDLNSKFHLLLQKFQALQHQVAVLSADKERHRKKWLQERRARLQTLVFSKACLKVFTD